MSSPPSPSLSAHECDTKAATDPSSAACAFSDSCADDELSLRSCAVSAAAGTALNISCAAAKDLAAEPWLPRIIPAMMAASCAGFLAARPILASLR